MDAPKKLTARQQSEQQSQLSETQKTAEEAHEFASVEAMLRHDSLHTPVPPSVEVRLQQSVEKERLQPAPWWRRFFGGAGE